MSPAKGRRHPVPRRRERREVLKAVAGAVSVLVVTAFTIWALRPGPSSRFDNGGGGIFNRQPRVSWLFVLTIAAIIGFGWWVMKSQGRPRKRRSAWLSSGLVLIVGVALVAGLMWPGGLLRKYQPAFDPTDLSDVTATTGLPSETTAVAPGTPASVTETTTSP
jgi:cytochrome bd-type quinol oxidase subunit 2